MLAGKHQNREPLSHHLLLLMGATSNKTLKPHHTSIMWNWLWRSIVTNPTCWSVEGCDILIIRWHVILERFHHKLCTDIEIFFVCFPLLQSHGNIIHSEVPYIQLLLSCIPESKQWTVDKSCTITLDEGIATLDESTDTVRQIILRKMSPQLLYLYHQQEAQSVVSCTCWNRTGLTH